MQEGLVRNLGSFSRFLQVASFSQGSVVTFTEIGREARINNKTVAGYFDLVEDLFLGVRLPVLAQNAKRRLILHPKFYFFDVGIYRALCQEPRNEIVLESLVFQELRALDDSLYFWRTSSGVEVDFVLYGPAGLHAIEVKHRTSISSKDLHSLKLFRKDYPEANCMLFYGGEHEQTIDGIRILPIADALRQLPWLLATSHSR